ncbi:hypothetical protein ACFCZT_03910 [Streptomyces sp. NPDC056230]|uniref:hypothetical protein n=1 Tax=Streptomyces sp. NPDC056230 TaxID=3345754 RepID=UPI0035DFFE9B
MSRTAVLHRGIAAPVTVMRPASALPHSTRPSHPTTVPGTITDTSSVSSTGRPVDPSASAPVRAPVPGHSLALAGSGTKRPRRRPDEAGTAAFRPQLVLTFGAE